MRRIKALLMVMTTVCILGTAAGCADRTDSGNGILDDAVNDVTEGVDKVTDDVTDEVDKATDNATDDVTDGVDKATDDVTDEIDKVTDEATKGRN